VIPECWYRSRPPCLFFQAILPGATPQAANRSTADIVTAIAEDGNDLNAEKVKFFWALVSGWQTGEKTYVAL